MTQEPEDLGFALPAAGNSSRARVVLIVCALVLTAFGVGYLQHRKARGDTPGRRVDKTSVTVEVTRPAALGSDRALALPGVIRPYEESKLFARTSGYVRRWLVDIGDVVKQGDLLVEIDAPEVAAQLAQARAQLAQAQAAVTQANAQRDFTKSNSVRYGALADQQLVSKSQLEQTQAQAQVDAASAAAAESNVAAQQANVRRLVELEAFARITAPFAGKVTTRAIERGALVSPGDKLPLYTIAATDPVRVFVDLPQTAVAGVKAGIDATITVREYPGREFHGKVTRSAGALDPELHTMTTEIQVPNADGVLLSGMYVQVAMTLSVPRTILEIPATALYSDAQGTRVAVVDARSKVHFATITIERDLGGTLWVATGLTGNESIIKIAAPSLLEGDSVEIAAPPKK